MPRGTAIGVLLISMLVFGAPLSAQLNLATVLGTIKDTSGAVVPNAAVVVKNLGTGLERSVTTDAGGDYTIPSLAIGHYSLSVSLTGFKTTTIPDFELQVGQSARIDAVLQVGSTTQEVTVSTTAPLLAATTSDVGQVVDRRVLQNIPLNGRAFWQLTQLTPGATYTPGGANPYTGSGAIRARAVNVSINGSDPQQTGWSLDGANITEVQLGGTEVQPNVDAIQEFKVESGNMGAEFGRTSNMVTAVIKSGTNHFHGDLFEFLRNDKLDARNFFFSAPAGSTQTKDILKRNQFGGVIGGPIKRDKAFFFADLEETRVRQALVFSNVVPSLAMRNGDFSSLLPGTQLLDPTNNYQPFVNNQIPSTIFSPQGLFFLKYMPTPNFSQGGVDRAVFGNRLALNTTKGDVKIDENVTSKDHLMGRYSIVDNDEANPNPYPALGAPDNHSRGQNFTLAYTHTFNPHWLNELRFGYYRMMFWFMAPLQGTRFDQEANMKGLDLQPYGGFPEIDLAGYDGFSGSPNNCLPKGNHVRSWEYADTVNYSSGKHNMKFGMYLYHSTLGFKNGGTSSGAFDYEGTYTGDAFADFLLGLPDNVSRDGSVPLQGNYGNFPAWFFQDNYRATDNLTLNLGLRYEVNTFYTGQRGQLSGFNLYTNQLVIPANFDPTAQAISAQLVPLYNDRYVLTNKLGLPLSIRAADKKDWGPRVGFAWRPFGSAKWAVRGAYGIFYAYPDNNQINNTSVAPPIAAFDTEFNDRPPAVPTRTMGDFFLGQPLAGLPNPNPGQPCPLGFVAISCATPSMSTGTINARLTYVQEYNFALQREITPSLSINLAYVGNNTHRLAQFVSRDDPPPGQGDIQPRRPLVEWGGIDYSQYGGRASYNAFQLSTVSRSWHGLSLLGNYTLSKCLDDGSSERGAPTTLLIPFNRARCNLDRFQASAFSYDYELPFGHGRHFGSSIPGWSNHILGGWEMSGILTLQTGLPFTATVGDRANTGVGGQRPDVIGTPIMPQSVSCWVFTSHNSACTALDPNAQDWFALPPKYERYGTGGRNILRADGLKVMDFALFKTFRLTESKTMEFRSEFFNFTNHPTFSSPRTRVDRGSGGTIGSTLNPARQIQFALKFYF
jgi:carboxypeptidase family protein